MSKVLRLGCVLDACRNPGCPCTELTVSAYSLDETVQGFGIEKGKLVASHVPLDDQPAALSKPLVLRLDVYTGELEDYEGAPLDLGDRRVAAIADALDAEMLDELEGLWRRWRGLASCAQQPKPEIEPWEPGELVRWDAVFELDRPEIFLDSGRPVVASDMYCVDPSCDCREVSISFDEGQLPGEPSRALPIGRVVASVRGGVKYHPATPSTEPRLRALWARYRRRHPRLEVPFARYGEIRAFAAEHATTLMAQASRVRTSPAPLVSAAPPLSAAPSAPQAASPGLGSASRDVPAQGAARAWVSPSRKRRAGR